MSGTEGEIQQAVHATLGASNASFTGTTNVEQQSGGTATGVGIQQMTVYGTANFGNQAVVQDKTHPGGEAEKRWFRVPQRNLIFTGRETELLRLHEALRIGNAALTPVPQALQGLGGVGKTLTAVEYVHRYRNHYDVVFWIIGETPEQLAANLAGLAPELDPSVPTQADQNTQLQLVYHWFETHLNWLLVVDNAENLPKLRPVLPPLTNGRLLLTTRDITIRPFAQPIVIERLDEVTGATLLLRRAGLLAPDAPLSAADLQLQRDAQAVSREVDGLPLALDQAGAYIETRHVTPTQYLFLYQKKRQTLHHNYENPDHASASITFALALEQVEKIPQYGKAAAELARLCAFLAPNAIPEEIFTVAPFVLGESLSRLANDAAEWNEVCFAATHYALMRRESTPSALWMHRLAQEVVREGLPEPQRKTTAERVVLAINAAFPHSEYPNWSLCEMLLPHMLYAEAYIETYDFKMLQAGQLVNKAGGYFYQRAQYAEVERCYNKALTIARQTQGEEHPDVATALSNLARLYLRINRAKEAIQLMEHTVEIDRKTIGEQHKDYAMHLDRLARAYSALGYYDDAELLYQKALVITEQALGQEHLDAAFRYNSLATLYATIGRNDQAIALYQRAQDIRRRINGVHHPNYAYCLVSLAEVYVQQNRFDLAFPLLMEAHTIYEQAGMAEHPDMATCIFLFGQACYQKGQKAEAQDYFRQALAIYERVFPPEHSDIVATREALALLAAEGFTG